MKNKKKNKNKKSFWCRIGLHDYTVDVDGGLIYECKKCDYMYLYRG
jgi:hypothetical protein